MYRQTTILYRLIDTLFRYRKLMLLSILIISVGPTVYISTRKPMYTATALTQCVTEDVTAALGDLAKEGGRTSWASIAQQNLDRFNEWEADDSADGFLASAFRLAQLDIPINISPKARDPRLTAFRKGLSTTTTSDTIFSISLVWDRPDECERILKALQDQYVEQVGLTHQAQSAAAAHFLDTELADYKGRLHVAEQALVDFKQNNAGQSPEQQSATMDQLGALRIQYNDLMISSGNSEQKRKTLQARLKNTPKTSMEEQHIQQLDSPTLALIKDLESSRNALLVQGYLATSDKVQAVDTKIIELQKELKKERDQEKKERDQEKTDPSHGKITETVYEANSAYAKLAEDLATVEIEADTAKAQIDLLRERISEYEVRISKMPKAEASLKDKTRDYTILKEQYENLLKRREEAQINMNLDKISATSKLHTIGQIFTQPTTSKTKKAMTLGGLLFVGLIVGVATTLLAEWLDPSLRSPEDAERHLGTCVLVAIPDTADLKRLPALSAQNTDSDFGNNPAIGR